MREHLMAPLMVLESVFPSRGGGGAEMQVQTLCVELQRRGVPVSVVVPMVNFGPQAASETVDGIPVTRLRYPKIPGLGAIWMLLSFAWLLLRERHRYDVIHSHIAGNMSAVCCLVGKLLGKPVVVKLTGLTEMRGGILDPAPRWSRGCARRHCSTPASIRRRVHALHARSPIAASRQRACGAFRTRSTWRGLHAAMPRWRMTTSGWSASMSAASKRRRAWTCC